MFISYFTLFQMSLGHLPLLTKGPFALFFGGDKIVGDLSEESPGRGMPFLLLGSAMFQIFLYVMRKAKSRKLRTYTHTLKRVLVENVLNIYGIIIIIFITIMSVAYIILHHWTIHKNSKGKITAKLVPTEIYYFYLVAFLITVVPFIKSYALR